MVKIYTTLTCCTVAGLLLMGSNAAFAQSSCSSQANPWVSVLIEQNPPDLDNPQVFVNKVHTFAPNLQQILLRVTPVNEKQNSELAAKYATLITDLRKAYPDPKFEIGFHPDGDKDDYAGWVNKDGTACTKDYNCVLNQSLDFMDTVDSKLQKGQGFNIYSIEQSYIEPQDSAGIKTVKALIKAREAKSNPTIKYAYVSPGYSPNLIGTDLYDYEYPQYYNLYTNPKSGTVPNLPGNKTTTANNYEIMDARPDPDPAGVKVLPDFLQPMHSVFEQGDPDAAAAYLAYILEQRSASYPLDSNNGTIYIALSGEPEFLGGAAWTPQKICTFQNDLISKLNSNGIDTSKAQFAIWNVSSIINHVT